MGARAVKEFVRAAHAALQAYAVTPRVLTGFPAYAAIAIIVLVLTLGAALEAYAVFPNMIT